jgi:hypothetical protein
VLPLVLGFLLIAGVFAAVAIADATADRALATTRLLQQRAFEAAERGIAIVMAELNSGVAAAPGPRRLSFPANPVDSAEVTLTAAGTSSLPEGLSTGRFIAHHSELRSAGRSARGTQVIQVQGLQRIEPVVDP